MTGIDSWSVTAATNATAEGGNINWSENQAPNTVNNTARAMCASIRSAFNDIIWFQYGSGDQSTSNLAKPCVYASATTFTVAAVDVSTIFHAGRRVRAVGSLTGTIYGTIASVAFSTNTTVTMVWDSGSLSNETLVISLSQIPITGYPLGGGFKVTSTNVFIGGSTAYLGELLTVERSTNATVAFVYGNNGSYGSNLMLLQTETAAGTGWTFINGRAASGVTTFAVYGNGNVINTNNSYGAISAKAVKQDIELAPRSWDMVKSLGQNVVRYRLKSDVAELKDAAPTLKGGLAEDWEEIAPHLVGMDGQTGLKFINYSGAYTEMLQAFAEAQERIETLEARIKALEK